MMNPNALGEILLRLEETIASRRLSSARESYVASLLQAPADKPLKKVAEEAAEFIMAAKDVSALLDQSCAMIEGSDEDARYQDTLRQCKARLIAEAADVHFHLQVALAYFNCRLSDVAEELARRENMSGHAEKTRRSP